MFTVFSLYLPHYCSSSGRGDGVGWTAQRRRSYEYITRAYTCAHAATWVSARGRLPLEVLVRVPGDESVWDEPVVAPGLAE